MLHKGTTALHWLFLYYLGPCSNSCTRHPSQEFARLQNSKVNGHNCHLCLSMDVGGSSSWMFIVRSNVCVQDCFKYLTQLIMFVRVTTRFYRLKIERSREITAELNDDAAFKH